MLPVVEAIKSIITENRKTPAPYLQLLSVVGVSRAVALISFIVFIQLKRLKVKEAIIEEKISTRKN